MSNVTKEVREMNPEELTGIPSEKVPDVVKGYIQSDAIKITVTKQNDGKWTIRAE